MEADRWREISALAALAAEMPPGEREALLGKRPDLRVEVESLLRCGPESTGPLDRPPAAPRAGSWEGKRIGPYRVIRELGVGGMGVVLLAERDDPEFPQRVAIKLVRMAFQSEFFERRFVEERRILAKLEHAHIARLLDGGVTEDGAPYLVMQHVEGIPLDEWRRRNAPGVREGIEVMLRVCAAVEYAHEHLVVHRDLKPANILVTADGSPMLLDFGTARLLDQAEPSGSTLTALPMMTARYASPEQAAGLAGSTRSDVYSLGVILYELLTGRWPYEEASGSVPELLRAVSEQEPRPPSQSGVDGPRRRYLEGDLDAILLKALDKSPERRYGTAQQLAADLRRYLAHEPVEARGLTWSYQAGRFVRRHRWGVAVAALVAASLASAMAYSFRQARIADREREKAVQVAMFLERLLGASRKGGVSPLATGGRELKVVDVVEAAAAGVGEEFKDSPDIEVGLRSTIGSALMALGTPEKAREHVERAVELSTKLYGDNHAASTRALTARGRLRMAAGDYGGAQADLKRAVRWHQAVESPDLSFQHSLLAEAYFRQANLAAARTHWEEALKAMRRTFGDKHVATATMISNLGAVTDEGGDAARAEQYFAEAAEILRGLPGPPGNLVFPLNGWQRAYFFRGDYQRALQICEEAYAHALKTAGARHPNAAVAMMQLAVVKAYSGAEGAEKLGREAAELLREIFPANHIEIARGDTSLGRVLLLAGKPSEVEPMLREALPMVRKMYAKANWRSAESQLFLGVALQAQGKTEDAATALRDGLREMREALPETHPRVRETQRIHDACAVSAEACVASLRVKAK